MENHQQQSWRARLSFRNATIVVCFFNLITVLLLLQGFLSGVSNPRLSRNLPDEAQHFNNGGLLMAPSIRVSDDGELWKQPDNSNHDHRLPQTVQHFNNGGLLMAPSIRVSDDGELWKKPDNSNHDHWLPQTVQHFNNGGLLMAPSIRVSDDGELWKQPDGLGYRPCLNFSKNYKTTTSKVGVKRQRFLLAVVAGGLNQQKTQIADAVVIARVLEAVLVLPVLQVDQVWGDQSEFSDIFDDQHFKESLKDDIRVISTLPASYLRRRPMYVPITPLQIDQDWVQTHLLGSLNKNRILMLRGFDSKLSKDLNPDLQKLRCKVVFEALKFRTWIEDIGDKLSKRMAQGGPYMALHLRLEKDVWLRTGCLPGLGKRADREIESARVSHPQLLTSRTNITPRTRYLSGLCPLNAREITRLLKGLGASNTTRIYWAGGVPFGGDTALDPFRSHFPQLYNKWNLSKEGELDSIKHKSSILAAIDYLVCLKSQVFMANHGGNMARTLQGHRAYLGHRKYITPNKKQLVQLFRNRTLGEMEMNQMIKIMHVRSMGSPITRTKKSGRDVIGFPVPECMCTQNNLHNIGFTDK